MTASDVLESCFFLGHDSGPSPLSWQSPPPPPPPPPNRRGPSSIYCHTSAGLKPERFPLSIKTASLAWFRRKYPGSKSGLSPQKMNNECYSVWKWQQFFTCQIKRAQKRGFKNSTDTQGVIGTAGSLRAIVWQAGRWWEWASGAPPEKFWSSLGPPVSSVRIEGLSCWGPWPWDKVLLPDLTCRPSSFTPAMRKKHREGFSVQSNVKSPDFSFPWAHSETLCKMRVWRKVLGGSIMERA